MESNILENVCDINNNKLIDNIESVCVRNCVHPLNSKQIILTSSQVPLKHFTYRNLVMCNDLPLSESFFFFSLCSNDTLPLH